VTPSSGIRAYPRLREAEEEFKRGRFDEASFATIQHLREHRDEPRGLALLGTIALQTGALVQSEQFLRRAMSLGVQSFEVQRTLASCLHYQQRLADALQAFSYLEQKSPDPELTATRAMILDRLARTGEALLAHEKALAAKPEEPQFLIAYGHSLRAVGRTEDAIAAYRKATSVDFERGEAWWAMASIKFEVLTDGDVETMQRALEVAVDPLNIVPLHFALGRAFHDRGRYSEAFAHYEQANRLRIEGIKYDAEQASEEVEAFMQLISRGLLTSQASDLSAGPIPVFLISMPRSGSTLLEQMLDQHPDIEAAGELPYVHALLRSAVELCLRREQTSVPQVIERLSDGQKRAFGEDYMQRARLHLSTGARYFIDKLPLNWRNVLFIREILPQARFIEIRRNAMDCCFSNYVHQFSLGHAASFDLAHLGRAYVDYVRLMDHVAEAAPGFMCRVRYDDLVDDPEPQLRAILDYLGLPWNDAMLRFHESDRTVRTPSAEQVRQPLNKSGIGAWKPYAEWLGPLRDALGPLATPDQ
jgi:tetratricopeptide (TPR) repeat protein